VIYRDDQPIKKWATKWDLDLTPDRCVRCRKILDDWHPFEHLQFVGAITKPHGCPAEYDHKVWAKKTGRPMFDVEVPNDD
jgi:hypothetical protein